MLWCCDLRKVFEAGCRGRGGAEVAGTRGTAPRHAPPHFAPPHNFVEQPVLLTLPLFDDTEDTPEIEIEMFYNRVKLYMLHYFYLKSVLE